MRYIIMFISTMMLLGAINKNDTITNNRVVKNKWIKKTLCFEGFLFVEVTDKNESFKISYPVCTTYSGWDNECTHKPIRCKGK